MQVRYRLYCEQDQIIGFSTEKHMDEKQLGHILKKLAESLLSEDKKRIIGECRGCWRFVLEGEEDTIITNADGHIIYCKECRYKEND